MAQTASNVLYPQNSTKNQALQGKIQGSPPLQPLVFSPVPNKPQSLISTKTQTSTPAIGKLPTAAPQTQVKAAAPVTQDIGSYKGNPITPGSSSVIQNQIQNIDKGAPANQPMAQIPQAAVPTPAAQAQPAQTQYANPLIQQAIDAQKRAVNINQALNQAVNDRTKQGIALPFVQGQQGAIQRDYGVQAAAASQEAQNAASLAGYGQPTPASYGQTTFNPLTGQFGGPGGVGANGAQPGDPMYAAIQNFAQGLANGTIPYNQIPGNITGNPVLNNQLLQLAGGGAGQGGGFNLTNTLGRTSAAQGVAANQAGYQAALNQATNQSTQLNDFIKTYIPNPDNASVANFVRAAIANNFSDPKYQQLKNYVDAIGSSFDEILGSGSGDKLINGLANGQGIIDTINVLNQQAQAKIAGTTIAQPGGSTGGGAQTGGSIWNF